MEKKIFLNGQIISTNNAFIEALVPWNLKGAGVFETMRSYRGKVFLLAQHLKRLERGLKTFKIRMPVSKKRAEKIIKEVLYCNKLKNARIRLTIWKEKRRVNISVVVYPYRPYSKKDHRRGYSVIVHKNRLDEKLPFLSIKSIDHQFYQSAGKKAQEKGYDEAIIINKKHEIVEGSRANIFFIKNNILNTPKLKCGCLNGITRSKVISLVKKNKIKINEGVFYIKDLLEADEAFLTNSVIEIMPLTSLENKRIGKGVPRGLTTKIIKDYRKLTK